MPAKLKLNEGANIDDDLLKEKVQGEKRSPFKKFLRVCAIGLHLLVPVIGWARLWKKTVTIYPGELGLSQNSNTGEYILLPPGRYILLSPFHNFTQRVQVNQKVVKLGPFAIVTADSGEVAVTNKNGV
ncbi:MAG: hypothetical protein H0U71_07555 [Gammaproteobacteria bacterium]|nr:hypothetical protein [Gammaproteobacteria bacterium]